MNYKDRFVTFKMIPTLDGKNTEAKIVDAIPIEWVKDYIKYETEIDYSIFIDRLLKDWEMYNDVEERY